MQEFWRLFIEKDPISHFISHLPPISHHMKSPLNRDILKHKWQYGRRFKGKKIILAFKVTPAYKQA